MGVEYNDFIKGPWQPEAPVNPYEEEDRELEEALSRIWDIAREFHLDPFPTQFEVVPPRIMSEFGAYGLPVRFSHWSYGRQYRQIKTMYDYGMSKIYELVINSNPSQAFLLENNPPIENKFVMAHVLGHTDFFKNNQLFAPTRKDEPETAVRNAERIRGYEESEGRLEVEAFLDAALAMETHVDPYTLFRPQRDDELKSWQAEFEKKRKPQKQEQAGEFDDVLGFMAVHAAVEVENDNKVQKLQIPPAPDSDILGFIRNHAPYLKDWQRDVLDIIRSESIYFYPQRRTKIMNEGWAAYWHKRIMREMGERDLISGADFEIWSKDHSGVVSERKDSLNPYYLGMKMYEYLEDYYNGNLTDKENDWLRKEGVEVFPHFEGKLQDSPASERLRDVMCCNDDQSFIRNYFNKIVADRMGLFIYEDRGVFNGDIIRVVKETGWKEIRDKLAASMTNCGDPYIVVVDGDYNNANELYLRHEFEGQTLDPGYIYKTLPYNYKLWQRPVHLETVSSKSERVLYSYDGTEVKFKTIS
jgi:stage V sporulation protein R